MAYYYYIIIIELVHIIIIIFQLLAHVDMDFYWLISLS